jgi:hypothetical protein
MANNAASALSAVVPAVMTHSRMATRLKSVSASCAPPHQRRSLRGLARPFGVSRQTVTSWLKKEMALPELSETLIEPHPPAPEQTALELDELWSLVLKRANKRWVWIALCRATRQVLAPFGQSRSFAARSPRPDTRR